MARGGKREGAGRKPGMDSAAKRELIDMAKDHGQAAVGVLAEIMNNKVESATARVSAATALLDRGYGKPTQTLAGTGKDGAVLIDAPELTPLETARRMAFVLASALQEKPE